MCMRCTLMRSSETARLGGTKRQNVLERIGGLNMPREPMKRFRVELGFTSDATIEQVRFLYEQHEFEVLEKTLALSAKEVLEEGRETTVSIDQKQKARGFKVGALRDVLNRVFKFPHNVNLLELFDSVYGPLDSTNESYRGSKMEMLLDKGFTWWYCDLDLANQEKVVKAMLDRYPELGGLLA